MWLVRVAGEKTEMEGNGGKARLRVVELMERVGGGHDRFNGE